MHVRDDVERYAEHDQERVPVSVEAKRCSSDGEEESRARPRTSAVMAVNIIGLGLLVAGVIFLIIGGVVLWILGVICVLGGVGALWMSWQRRRRAAT
jgi:hypothetical protein